MSGERFLLLEQKKNGKTDKSKRQYRLFVRIFISSYRNLTEGDGRVSVLLMNLPFAH